MGNLSDVVSDNRRNYLWFTNKMFSSSGFFISSNRSPVNLAMDFLGSSAQLAHFLFCGESFWNFTLFV